MRGWAAPWTKRTRAHPYINLATLHCCCALWVFHPSIFYCILLAKHPLILIHLCLCSIVDKPLIRGCPDHHTGVEHDFSMDMLPCRAEGNPPPTVQWYFQGKLINGSERLTRIHSGKYTAEVANRIGSSKTSIDITIECECIRLWLYISLQYRSFSMILSLYYDYHVRGSCFFIYFFWICIKKKNRCSLSLSYYLHI